MHFLKWVITKMKDQTITCAKCKWEWKLSDGGSKPYLCHKCGRDNNPLKEYIRKIVKEEMGGATMNAQEMTRHKKKLQKLKKILATQGDQMMAYPKSLPNTVFNAKLINKK